MRALLLLIKTMEMRTYKKLAKLLQKVVYGDSACHVGQQAHHLLQRVLNDTAINLNAGKTKNAEDRSQNDVLVRGPGLVQQQEMARSHETVFRTSRS